MNSFLLRKCFPALHPICNNPQDQKNRKMTARFLRLLQFVIAAFDVFALNVLCFGIVNSFPGDLLQRYWEYTYLVVFITLVWLGIAFAINLYHGKHIFSFEGFVKRSMKGVLYLIVFTVIYLFFFHQYTISRAVVSTILCSIPVLVLINRVIFFSIYKHYKYKDYLMDKVVIVGYNNTSKKLISHFEENAYNKEIIGICDEPQNVNEVYHHPILSGIGDAFNVCKRYGANEIFSSIAPEQNPEIYNLIKFADQNCIRFKIVPDISLFVKRKVHVNYIEEMPILSLRDEPLEDLSNRINKRLFDIVVSLLIIGLFLSWLIPILALLIKIDSKGPVFFKQKRSGKGNKAFSCIKFRSMKVNDRSDTLQATKNDSRFTWLGKFLRRTNLDEFPQFFNALVGNMSIVGPRPHMLKHTDEYSQMANQYMLRHFMKPGITGWAQIKGYRGEIDSVEKLESRVEHDIWYMENWSIWLDLRIILLTVYNTFKGDKNAF
jgi:putative colanic acid biosysnthesis UDP-glucose lipid carrier transferase